MITLANAWCDVFGDFFPITCASHGDARGAVMKVLDAVVQGRVSELNTKAAELRQRIERQLGSMQDEEEAAEQEAALITAAMQQVES